MTGALGTLVGNPSDPLKIFGLKPIGDTASSASPFVSKLELFCRMAGLDYEAEQNLAGPKGKVPFIRHGDVLLGDSSFIIEYLRRTYGSRIQLAKTKTAEERAKAVACQRICEDQLYYGLIHHRWINKKGFAQMKVFLTNAGLGPRPLMPVITRVARKGLVKLMQVQGMGRHSEQEIDTIMDANLEALSVFLGDQPFMLGDAPSDVDATVFGFIDNLLNDGLHTNLKAMVEKYPNLVAYVKRIREDYFPASFPSKFAKI